MTRRRFPLVSKWLDSAVWEARRLKHPFADVAGVRVRIARAFPFRVRVFLYNGRYESAEIAVLSSCLDTRDIVMELGTGLGVLSAYVAKRIGSERVFTYEANPALGPLIRDTFAVNRVSPTLEMCMLGARPGSMTLFVEDEFWYTSTIRHSSSGKAISIPMREFAEEVRRIQPTLLIVDIEGGEYDLADSMASSGISKILMELHEAALGAAKVNEVKSTFVRAGYTIDPIHSTDSCVLFSRQ